jgi:hypothetical protein
LAKELPPANRPAYRGRRLRLLSLLVALPLAAATAGGSQVLAKVPVPGTTWGAAGGVWVSEATFGRLLRIVWRIHPG